MIIVREKSLNNEIFFEVEINEGNNKVTFNEICYKSLVIDEDNFSYVIMYNKLMEPISSVFDFLNFYKSNHSINSRLKGLQALKLLFCYQDIVNKDLESFSSYDLNGLKYFLKGYSSKGEVINLELKSLRSNETINSYLSVYRGYLSFLGKENKALNKLSATNASINVSDDLNDLKITKYASNEKVAKKVVEVPKYISVEDFKKIIQHVREKYTLREEIIIRFMFECGLRIGEVLGMTADDLIVEKIGENYVPILYIRNRLSDNKDQQAKTCMKVIDKKQYKSKEYNTKDFGYQIVVVPEDLYKITNDYIEEAHLKARENKSDNYYKYTKADRVRKDESFEDINYYIFINTQGTPLSVISWNVILRNIFVACGISIDKKTRENNLNHRFRHGFAMFNVQYLNCKAIELQARLRHKTLHSVSCYFKPTIEDAIKIKTDFTESLADVIPEILKVQK